MDIYESLLDDDDFSTKAKIPSLLSTHLDSPVRTHMIEYSISKLNKILREPAQFQKPSHPFQYRFVIQDIKYLNSHQNVLSPHLMNAAHFGILNNCPLEDLRLTHSNDLLEKILSTALRNTELQISEFFLPDLLYETPDVAERKRKEYSCLRQNLSSIFANKPALIKNIPRLILHQFSWFNILHQAVLCTGLTNETENINQDKTKFNLFWQSLRQNSGQFNSCDFEDYDNNPIFHLDQDCLRLYASRNLFYIIDKDGNHHIGTREHLLMFCDLFLQRFNLYMTGFLGAKIGFAHYLDIKELHNIFSWGDKILSKIGNKSFDILSKWEPLCVGVFLKYSDDPYCEKEKFLDSIQSELIQDFSPILPNISNHLLHLEEMHFQLFEKSYHKLSQAFGLFRLWGHPNIDSRLGILKLKQIAQQHRLPNKTKIRQITCIFMEKFCIDYRAKKGAWPALNCSKLRSTNLINRAYTSNSVLSLTAKNYNRRDWIHVKMDKTFEITDKLNLSDLISDKALSLQLTELMNQVLKYKNIGLATDKSVIVQWLKSDWYDPLSFLKDIEKNGFGYEESIFGVCPKERELKLVARFFGLATLRKRMYIVLTEAMIAEFIIPHFPQITMMDNSLTLSKKFFDKTKTMTRNNTFNKHPSVNIITNIDFQKWNTYMRKEETFDIFDQMDRLFGLQNCISRTHEMFQNSQLYLADGTYLPQFERQNGKIQMIENEYVWSGHLGGIEGLRQKGWTIFTVCILESVMELNLNCKFSLMGQGDNQVLIVHFPATLSVENIKSLHHKLLDSLESELKLIGPPLKREETWSSSSLFIYGKFLIYQGCPLTMSQKKICRMFPMSNEGFPTVETAISSITANCSAACASDLNPVIPFIMNSMWNTFVFNEMFIINYLGFSVHDALFSSATLDFVLPGKRQNRYFKAVLSKNLIQNLKTRSPELLLAYNLFPKFLGGYPISFLSQYFIKGFPDPITEYFSILKTLYPLLNSTEKCLIDNLLFPHFNSEINTEYFFSNPVGINLISPITPMDIVKSTVTRFISQATWINNQYVREFLNLLGESQENLADVLYQMTPLNPLVCHAILEATIIGRAKQVVDQLNKTSTLIKITAKNGDDLLGRVRRSEKNYLISSIFQLTQRGSHFINLNLCSRIIAQKLREISWGNSLITGVTVPYPLECFSLQEGYVCDNHMNTDKGYILLKQTIQNPEHNWWKGLYIGDAVPYMGSKTIDKVRSYGKRVAKNSTPLIKRVTGLQSLIGWATERDSNLSRCLQRLVTAVTDIPPDLLNPEDAAISGSLEHRFYSEAVNRGGNVEMLFNFATFLTLATDTLSAYSKGSANVNLHFQASLSLGTSWFSFLRSLNVGELTLCYHLHQKCIDCIIPINETKLDIPEGTWESLIKSQPNSLFCWIGKERILNDSKSNSLGYPGFGSSHIDMTYEDKMLRACRLASRETMIKFRQLSLEIGDGKLATRTGWTFPVAWVFKLDPFCFFITFYIELKSFFLFRQFEIKIKKALDDNKIEDDFVGFMNGIPFQVLGFFSSWFQNSSFLDYISGSPLFVRPPLQSSYTRSSCGACIKSLLLTLHLRLEMGSVDLKWFNNWRLFFTSGEESLDSNPLLLSIMYHDIIDRQLITDYSNLNLFLYLKRILPLIYRDFPNMSIDGRKLLWENMRQYEQYLPKSIIQELNIFLNTLNIYHVIDTADGYITDFPVYIMNTQLYDLPHKDISHLALSCGYINVEEHDFIISPKSISATIQANVETLPVSLEVHRHKTISYPTTSQYKLLSILQQLRLYINSSDTVGCFGDGAGGFSRLMIETYHCKVFYNSLIDTANLFPNAIGNQYPACFAGNPVERSHLIGLDFTFQYMSDLTNFNYAKHYIRYVDIPLKIIISDAEGGGWESSEKSIKMLTNLLQLCVFSSSECVIFKTYYSNWEGLEDLILMMHKFFEKIKIYRSYFSSQNSTEIYLIGQKLIPNHKTELKSIILSNNISIYSKFNLVHNFINQKAILIRLSKIIPSDSVSQQYNAHLSSLTSQKQDIINLFGLSPSLLDYIGSDKKQYKFPSQYMRDCKLNTHLVKFNNKFHKTTKFNFLTKALIKRIVMGFLTIAISDPRSDIKELERAVKDDSIVFYPTYDHNWSFAFVETKSIYKKNIKYMRLSYLILQKDKKEICSKSAILKPYVYKNITLHMILSRPLRFSLKRKYIDGSDYYQFHAAFTPLQLSSDPDVNQYVLNLPPTYYDSGSSDLINLLIKSWNTNKEKFKQTYYWTGPHH